MCVLLENIRNKNKLKKFLMKFVQNSADLSSEPTDGNDLVDGSDSAKCL